MMEYIKLRGSDLRVSRLGFGCCPMSGFGWGDVSTAELEKSVQLALEGGLNLFDTADIYGFGESERRLGQYLKGRRHQAIIATKFGMKKIQGETSFDNSEAWMTQALEGSLRRLQTDYVDLYQVHYLDGKTPMGSILEALQRKKDEGKIRYYGFSNITSQNLSLESFHPGPATFQVHYSLAYRRNEDDIRLFAEKRALDFMSWGSLGQGILTGKYDMASAFPPEDRRSRPVYVNFHENRAKSLAVVEAMKKLSSYPQRTLAQIAIRWIMDHLAFGVVLVGIKKAEQIKENLGSFGWTLSPEEIQALDQASQPIS